MNLIMCDAAEKIDEKAKIIGVLEENNIPFKISNCCGSNKICIDLNSENEACNKPCCNADIIVQTSNKDVCRIRPSEILYIAIENRKSAVYIDGKRIETNYHLNHWRNILNPKIFAQPHNSFIVNLSYVEDVTKDFVIIKHKGKEYPVYTSSRKINGFKKAFLEYKK